MATTIRVATHINRGPALDMLSSLIIGSEACILVDAPLTVPEAQKVVSWIKEQTSVPLVGLFTTHFHPDHYLSAAVVLEAFPTARFYANSKAVSLIKNEAQKKADFWGGILGPDNVVKVPAIPEPFDYSFLKLAGQEIIHLLSPISGDGPDETMFWIPSIKTLIAGDVVYSQNMHIWLADLVDPLMTKAWLQSLDFVEALGADVIIPGHAIDDSEDFSGNEALSHTRAYIEFFQTEIEARDKDTFTVEEIKAKLEKAFPGLTGRNGSQTSATLIEINGQHFGKGGSRQHHFTDLAAHQKAMLTSWALV